MLKMPDVLKMCFRTGLGVIGQEATACSPCFSTSDSEIESDASESRDSGERPRYVPTPRREPSTDVDLSTISNSPIKTFRRIGQLDDCLIDFNNQFKKSDTIKRKQVKTGTKRKGKTRRKGSKRKS